MGSVTQSTDRRRGITFLMFAPVLLRALLRIGPPLPTDHGNRNAEAERDGGRLASTAQKTTTGALEEATGRQALIHDSNDAVQNEILPPSCQNRGSCDALAAPKLPSGKLVSTLA